MSDNVTTGALQGLTWAQLKVWGGLADGRGFYQGYETFQCSMYLWYTFRFDLAVGVLEALS